MSAGISVIPALSVKFRFGFDMNTRFKLKRRYENTIGYHVSFGTRMILPTTIALVMIFLIPVIFVTYMSFQEWSMSLVKKPEFVGFENYMRALSSRDFWNSMRATALFTGIGVILRSNSCCDCVSLAFDAKPNTRYSKLFCDRIRIRYNSLVI